MTIPDEPGALARPDLSVLLPIAREGDVDLPPDDVAQRLQRFSTLYQSAMQPATVRAVRGDWATYATWCKATGRAPLGIDRDGLVAFFRNAVDRGLRRATLDRYLFTIRLAHRAAERPDPTQHPEWRLHWRGIVKSLADDGRNRRRPAAPLRQATVAAVITQLEPDLRELRDAALMCLASDTLARRQEIARVRVEELKSLGDVGVLEIPTSKTDVEGHGRLRHVSAATMQHVRRWLTAAGTERGPIFRAVRYRFERDKNGKRVRVARVGDRALAPQEIARIFKRRLEQFGFDATRISGHSTRIGSTHDLVDLRYTGAAIARVGGWANEAMVVYYARELDTRDTAMADARARQPLPSPESLSAPRMPADHETDSGP